MAINEIEKQTNANIQEKANLIWSIATHIVGLYKPHEYGKVILPFTVLKRFDDALKVTKKAVVEQNKKLVSQCWCENPKQRLKINTIKNTLPKSKVFFLIYCLKFTPIFCIV
jgi:type I restriction-modification system DNA methylase subunit